MAKTVQLVPADVTSLCLCRHFVSLQQPGVNKFLYSPPELEHKLISNPLLSFQFSELILYGL